jgi:hypothetical protein
MRSGAALVADLASDRRLGLARLAGAPAGRALLSRLASAVRRLFVPSAVSTRRLMAAGGTAGQADSQGLADGVGKTAESAE